MKREHARIVNEQSRTLQDVVAREVEARAAMETMVREKAETDVQINSLKDRTNALNAELEREAAVWGGVAPTSFSEGTPPWL